MLVLQRRVIMDALSTDPQSNALGPLIMVLGFGGALWLGAILLRVSEMRSRGEKFDDEQMDRFFRLNGSGLGDLGDYAGKCPVSLPPLVVWPGGKSRMAKKLIGMMPKHETYVEPFAGGASVFFAKPLVKRNVLSDADPWLTSLYNDVKRNRLEDCEGGIKASRSLFGRSLKSRSACHKVALSTLSFHGDRKTYGAVSKEGRMVLVTKLGKQSCFRDKLKKAVVVRGDFAATMRKYDGKNTVHYLDPPWTLDYSDKYHAHGGARAGKSRDPKSFGGAMSPERVKKVSDSMKGTVIVHYNWTPELARLFSGKKWKTMKVAAATNTGRRTEARPNLIAIKKAA